MGKKSALTRLFSVELRGLETPDLFHAIDSRPVWWRALRLAIAHPRPPLTATVRADW
jgi:hypothetical protein